MSISRLYVDHPYRVRPPDGLVRRFQSRRRGGGRRFRGDGYFVIVVLGVYVDVSLKRNEFQVSSD